MSRPWALVTPASRGIGLEVARRLLQTTQVPVLATARKDLDQTKESILEGLKDVEEDRLHVLKVDVLDESSISAAASHAAHLFPTQSWSLRLGFCLPGLLFPEKSPAQIDHDHALLTFRTNTLGPMLLIKHFSPFLPRKTTPLPPRQEDEPGRQNLPHFAVWATLGARVGSISDNRLGGWYSYRASKAGVHQVARTFDQHLRTTAGDRAISLALHPGTVKTGLSRAFWGNVKEGKLFSPEFAAERLVEVCRGTGREGEAERLRGRCWDWEGKEVSP